jgi:hypothetical protein
MAINIQVLKDFIDILIEYNPDCLIWVDEGGISLESESGGYIEVGGKPEND